MSDDAHRLLHRQTYDGIAATAFNTPLIRLRRTVPPDLAEVLLKAELLNPLSSVKDRIGISMIEAGEQSGHVGPGTHVVEPTSGNTGIALAFVCAAKGYRLTLTMPETMSAERRGLLRALGADLVLTPERDGMGAAIARALDIVHSEPHAWMPQQFANPANPAIHEATTGPEIWADTAGDVDAVVCGVGTGGTITGVTRYIRRFNPDFKAIAIEPARSAVLLGGSPGEHQIQGIGAGFVPETCDTSLLDGVVTVTDEEAFDSTRRLPVEEGILGGISTGANLCGTAKAIEKHGLHGRRIVTVGCSAGERYLSTDVFRHLMK